eukprot:13824355-Ditylum_brightwellii.AAC.1
MDDIGSMHCFCTYLRWMKKSEDTTNTTLVAGFCHTHPLEYSDNDDDDDEEEATDPAQHESNLVIFTLSSSNQIVNKNELGGATSMFSMIKKGCH